MEAPRGASIGIGGGALSNPDPRDATGDEVAAMSRLLSLGHDRDRLAELTPKVRELFVMIEKVRAAKIQSHEMAVNYPTSFDVWVSEGAEGVPLLPAEGQPPRT
jgi:hypothetical protein